MTRPTPQERAEMRERTQHATSAPRWTKTALDTLLDALEAAEAELAETKANLEEVLTFITSGSGVYDKLVEALGREAALREALEEYAEHISWRCQYRSRYGKCLCGLDETMASLGLPPVAVNDIEWAGRK